GCDYTAPVVEITFVDEPDLTLEAMDPACPMEETGTITATGMGGASGYSYSLDGGVFQASGEFMDVSIGTHTVEIIDGNGCINEAQINLFAPLTPQVTISGPTTVISENDATYTVDIQDADNIEDIIWTSGGQIVCQGINCTEFTAVNAISDFELSVEVIYNGGCMAFSESFLVDVKEIQAYYIPNIVAFSGTPGVNSRWTMYIKGNETFPRSIKVYTRWGNLIYDNNFNITTPEAEVDLWDGFSGDNQVESGVYVYAMEIEIEGRSEFIVGDITILR
ncbi:MAG: gliding motility-associated C-terminal domain-containing protein, partial [Saprospiraceae bacterium]